MDLVAIHDWQACPVALLRDLEYADDPIVGRAAIALTIHNLAYHGWTPRDRVVQLGLGAAAASVGDEWGIDLLREGIRRAETVNTVSPTYAREVLEPAAGMGLDRDLVARGDRFGGILNGLDEAALGPGRRRCARRPVRRLGSRRQGGSAGRISWSASASTPRTHRQCSA